LIGLKHGVVVDEAAIGEKFRALAGELNERQRRLLRGGPQPWGREADRDVDRGDDRGD